MGGIVTNIFFCFFKSLKLVTITGVATKLRKQYGHNNMNMHTVMHFSHSNDP